MPDQHSKLPFYLSVILNSKAMLLKFLNDLSLARAFNGITLKNTSDYKMIDPTQKTTWNRHKRERSIRLKQTPLLTCIDGQVLSTTAFVVSLVPVCVCVSFWKMLRRFWLITNSQLANRLTFLPEDVWYVSFSLSSSLYYDLGNHKVKEELSWFVVWEFFSSRW